jgi:hypothetical protein
VVLVDAAHAPEAVPRELLLQRGGHVADGVVALGRQRRVDEAAVGGQYLAAGAWASRVIWP